MRKNLAKHTAKKLPLAKRVLALCFALIFVCSCLLPAFANGTGEGLDTPGTEVVEAADPGTEPEPMDLYDEPAALDDDFAVADEPAAMDDDFAVADEPAAMDDDFAVADEPEAMDDDFAMDDEPAAMDDQVEKPVVDDEPAAMDNEVEKPVEGGEPPVADDTPAAEGATKTTTDASGNIVYEYDTSGTTFPEDDAAALPDGDQVLDQMDAAFSIPTNIYHFWLKKMSSYDLADIATDAEAAEMTVEQYLAMYGTDKGCYHIMTAADGANLKDYQFADPTSNDDPEGNSRTFAGWYYTDDLGDEQKFVFDEHLYVSEGTTVEVYAKWTDEENLDGEQKQEEAGKTEEKQENKEEKYQQMLIKLISCESMEEQVMLWADYCDMDDFDAFYEYAESLDGAVKEAFENLIISITDFQESGIALLAEADTGVHNGTLTVGEKITIKCNGRNSQNHSNYTWIARDEEGNPTNLVTIVMKSDGSAVITAEKAGTVTIYHYGTYWWFGEQHDYSEWKTFTINAKSYDNASAKIFYLNSPTENPNRNDTYVWLPSGGQSDWKGEVNTTGATWETGPEYQWSNNRWSITYNINKNIYLNRLSESEVKNYIKKWPDGTTDATWTLKRSDGPNSRFFTVLNAIWDDNTGYKAKLAKDLGIEESQLSKDAIQEIILVPYKISNNNDGYHIDCNITIKSSQSFTAVFLVQQPGVSTYERVFAKNYPLKADGTAAKPIAIVTTDDIRSYKFTQTYNQEIDETKEVNGVTYKFVGWYPENSSGEPHGSTLIDTWPYDPSIAELSDGTVNFYAKYVRDSSEAYVTKIVNGLFGDKEKEFHFTWDVNGEPGTNFDLADNQTTDDSIGMRLAVNDVLTLTETNAAGYTTTAIITDAHGNQLSGTAEIQATGEKEDDRKTITVTISEEMLKNDDGKFYITVINERDATIDNGVLLDTLPYILILVVVAGGGVLLFLRKRKNDDDE